MIILILLLGLIFGLYFYHQDNWTQSREQVKQFKVRIDKVESKEVQKVETVSEDKQQITDNHVELKSPFNSKLATEMALELKENNNTGEVKERIEKEQKVEIQRPDFVLKGIVIIGEYKRVNIQAAGEYQRLSQGDMIEGFTLVNISRNSVTFKKDESYFEFRIDDRDQR